MAKKKKLFKSKERKNRVDVSSFLHQLADKIALGQVVFKQGSDEITLELPHSMVLEVDVEDKPKKVKGVKHTIELEMVWFDNDKGGPLVVE
jgi:amphi-Trp domain-containing protein